MDRTTMSIWKWAALAAVVVAVAGIVWYVYAVPEEEEVFCTADAMQCPDGTWVGRSGPNCQFVCPGQASTSASLEGTVVAP